MRTFKGYEVVDFKKSYPDLELIKDDTMISPYERYPNHKLINFKINKFPKNQVKIKIKLEKEFINDLNEFEDKYKSDLIELIYGNF